MTKEQRYKTIAREIDFVDGIMRVRFDDYGEETHRALKEAVEIITALSVVPEKEEGTPYKEKEKGEWIRHKSKLANTEDSRECSNCHVWLNWDMPRNSFCPNCGADMRGE